jgi:hypothetical protein
MTRVTVALQNDEAIYSCKKQNQYISERVIVNGINRLGALGIGLSHRRRMAVHN